MHSDSEALITFHSKATNSFSPLRLSFLDVAHRKPRIHRRPSQSVRRCADFADFVTMLQECQIEMLNVNL